MNAGIGQYIALWKGLYKGDDPPSSSVLFCLF